MAWMAFSRRRKPLKRRQCGPTADEWESIAPDRQTPSGSLRKEKSALILNALTHSCRTASDTSSAHRFERLSIRQKSALLEIGNRQSNGTLNCSARHRPSAWQSPNVVEEEIFPGVSRASGSSIH